MPIAPYGGGNFWLTCMTIDPAKFGASREDVRLALEAHNIESRPVWKPLHMQPVFAGCRARKGDFAASVFERGLCLPSGSSLSSADLERICEIVIAAPQNRKGGQS
jgi:pyridoxal phosphate-dependent aminotransferase EpsN